VLQLAVRHAFSMTCLRRVGIRLNNNAIDDVQRPAHQVTNIVFACRLIRFEGLDLDDRIHQMVAKFGPLIRIHNGSYCLIDIPVDVTMGAFAARLNPAVEDIDFTAGQLRAPRLSLLDAQQLALSSEGIGGREDTFDFLTLHLVHVCLARDLFLKCVATLAHFVADLDEGHL
jgi:hypothetical protein